MNIKEEIGRRIFAARKANGLTRKALSELTDDLKQSRINNWERGERTPGPEEIKQLAKALDVSAAYLMCLTDQKHLRSTAHGVNVFIPLLDTTQACDPLAMIQAIQETDNHQVTLIPLNNGINPQLSKHTFALKMPDDSMEPELRRHDILIIDPDQMPQPGSFVVAKLEDNTEVIVRRYKQLSVTKNSQQFELLAMNQHWAGVVDGSKCVMVGAVCGLFRVI